MSYESILENTRKWRKTKRGLITNLYQKLRYRHPVEFDLEWLHDFSKTKRFDRLFDEWVKSAYQKNKKPSLDRILNKKSYTKANVQWLTWAENRHKQTMERRTRKGRVIQMKVGAVVCVHRSQREAARSTGISQGNISTCLTGKRPLAGGFSWAYENQHSELLE